MARVSLEQAAAYYRVELPEVRRVGDEIRTRCFLACGRRGETGVRARYAGRAAPRRYAGYEPRTLSQVSLQPRQESAWAMGGSVARPTMSMKKM